MKFYVAEVQKVNSVREAEEISAKDLTEAKRKASRGQAFCGTVLVIGTEINEDGFITDPMVYKESGKWHNI